MNGTAVTGAATEDEKGVLYALPLLLCVFDVVKAGGETEITVAIGILPEGYVAEYAGGIDCVSGEIVCVEYTDE